jgi:hypothetical protein
MDLYREATSHLTSEKSEKAAKKVGFTAAFDRLLGLAVVGEGMKAWVRRMCLRQFDIACSPEDVFLWLHNPSASDQKLQDLAVFEREEQPDYERLRLENALADYFTTMIANLEVLLPDWIEKELNWQKAGRLLEILLNPGDEELPESDYQGFFELVREIGLLEEGKLLLGWVEEFNEKVPAQNFSEAVPVLRRLMVRE